MPTQDTYQGGTESKIRKCKSLQQAGCESRILVHSSGGRVANPDNIPHSIRQILLEAFAIRLSVSQDLFQAKMDQILEGLHGVASVADDIVVYGKDEEEHNRNLTALMEQAAEAGMVFNSDKCTIKQNNISTCTLTVTLNQTLQN